MTDVTLFHRGSPLADPAHQVAVLRDVNGRKPFGEALAECGLCPLRATGIEVFQLNLGKRCNQACRHCHVDAGRNRPEVMSRETAEACLDLLGRSDVPTLDLTGGAPEMNPNFRTLVEGARKLGRHVIDRCNLTILTEPGFEDLCEFLAEQGVEVVASLPCHRQQNVDSQRGGGVFERSIEAIRRLNRLGYGRPESELVLTLVYNPLSAVLPPAQDSLEDAYRDELQHRCGVVFNRLFTLTNMPIGRFLHELIRRGQFDSYMQTLVDAFNPKAARRVMCRTTLSVGWTGRLHDCDFNQVLNLALHETMPQHVADFDPAQLASRRIITGEYCYGCTAGAGSSCQGATIRQNAE